MQATAGDTTNIQSIIKDTTVVSGHGSTTEETNFTSTDKLYLLSTHEIYVDVDNNASSGLDYYDTGYANTRQLDYYAGNGDTTSQITTSNYDSDNANTPKKTGGSVNYWWLRAGSFIYDDYFMDVNNSGRWFHSYALDTDGLSPAFRIGV